MPRPTKFRFVEHIPRLTYFKPKGVPLRDLEEVNLNIEELESIRLKDLEGLDQESCAERMKVSRATFQRVLTSAREKIAEALIYGKAIRIEGGDFKVIARRFFCRACNLEWEVQNGYSQEDTRESSNNNIECPDCGSKEVITVPPRGRDRCWRKGRHGYGGPPFRNSDDVDE
ncbi:hypothetical protein H0A61_01794 [Koleobacter methoxysyntrophicus]|uniref:UPF0251 protein H0A61_01794 n=1 Tax=Koleobacter methoxysyntrophicus TaxID=2751313 RepID=A0A8A0RM06_9FIRM|nr:DUF134 domain-containing protein [Koleobacter methoxysyntrophicus]QSQ09431.1 hypothetical protein H0A61_01794 [Koleobacter methoxysyntrophicus]